MVGLAYRGGRCGELPGLVCRKGSARTVLMLKRQIKHRRLHVGCKLFLLVGVLSAAALLTVKPLASQTREQTTVARKLVTRVEPEYPETLQRLFIGGVVR